VKLYDSLIDDIPSFVYGREVCSYPYDENKCWTENQDYELILQKDTAFELGGRGFDSVNYTLVTTDSDYVEKDETVVYGQELQNISKDTYYARIAVVKVRDNDIWNTDSEKLYQMLSDIDFIKYHIFPKGYMFRNSGQTGREQVRVGKKELKEGMTFEYIGNTIIRHFKRNPEILSVKLIFITADSADYKKIREAAEKTTEIRRSLSMINKNLPTECSVCGIRDICNEVEGLKELHFGKKGAKEKQQLIL